ncbi:MAG: hypothetical protein JWO53_454, partial [Chlamydiia bacterium]|nr:hypothetical protein [Chlamydiia bacterium]
MTSISSLDADFLRQLQISVDSAAAPSFTPMAQMQASPYYLSPRSGVKKELRVLQLHSDQPLSPSRKRLVINPPISSRNSSTNLLPNYNYSPSSSPPSSPRLPSPHSVSEAATPHLPSRKVVAMQKKKMYRKEGKKSLFDSLPNNCIFSIIDFFKRINNGGFLANKDVASLFQLSKEMHSLKRQFLVDRNREVSALLTAQIQKERFHPFLIKIFTEIGMKVSRLDLSAMQLQSDFPEKRSSGCCSPKSEKSMMTNLNCVQLVNFFPNSTHLRVSGCNLTDFCLKWFAKLPHITQLDISNNPKITDAGISRELVAALEVLDIGKCESLTDQTLATLGRYAKKLTTLSLK